MNTPLLPFTRLRLVLNKEVVKKKNVGEDFKKSLGFDLFLVLILPPAGDRSLTLSSDKQLGKMMSDTKFKGCLFHFILRGFT